jgi:hypothetical protein
MTALRTPAVLVIDGVDVGWKIFHLERSIRNRERLLTFTGFATPRTPEAPAVIEERVAQQVAVIEQKRVELAHWQNIAARTVTPANF